MIMNRKELIDSVLEQVDFSKIHKCMTILDWKWHNMDYSPTIEQLKATAIQLLNDALGFALERPEKTGAISTGGFYACAEIMDEQTSLSLTFMLEEGESTEEWIKD